MAEIRFVNLPGAVAPKGYSDAGVVSAAAQQIVLGGHVAFDAQRNIVAPGDICGQMRQTLKNLRATLAACGATPAHLVKLKIHVTDVSAYKANLKTIGAIWREELGAVYPAMTLVGVTALFEPGSVVELDGIAVV
jgi:enamine deaminase RidA (YjgF/YER057c/UK114 family)